MTVALGGVWDESAIRGLPTTFRTPAAGRVISALVEAKVRNPVLVLDELDKVGGRTSNHGDPSAALLEVLDPEQNTRFRDVYLDVPFDLSEVLFIATANDLAGIPAPLRDRLEVIEAPGYTDEEKVDIVRRNLWGAQLEAAGLTGGGFWTRPPEETPAGARAGRQVTVEVLDGELDGEPAAPVEITDAAALEVVRGHTCEAGVRELSRQLGAICEGVASRRVETGDTAPVTVVAVAGEAAGLARPAAASRWRSSWDRRGTTRCPTVSGTRSRGSGTASWACIRPTPRRWPRRRGSRWRQDSRGAGRWRSGSTRCFFGRPSTRNTSAAAVRRTRRWTTWWPARPRRRHTGRPATASRPRSSPSTSAASCRAASGCAMRGRWTTCSRWCCQTS